jgi:hypothetical protein
MNRDVWALNQHNIVQALQAIWNEVYKGCDRDGRKKIRHIVAVGGAVHEVVCQFMMLSITASKSANYSQAIQRLIEWRNSISSNGLAVVGDFLDSMNLRTTEAYQEVADHLLNEERYAYFETKDKIENRKVNVSKTSLSTWPVCCSTVTNQCRSCKKVVIVMAWWFRRWHSAGSTLKTLSMCQASLMVKTSPTPLSSSAQPQ